jgi:hypothetical protein
MAVILVDLISNFDTIYIQDYHLDSPSSQRLNPFNENRIGSSQILQWNAIFEVNNVNCCLEIEILLPGGACEARGNRKLFYEQGSAKRMGRRIGQENFACAFGTIRQFARR